MHSSLANNDFDQYVIVIRTMDTNNNKLFGISPVHNCSGMREMTQVQLGKAQGHFLPVYSIGQNCLFYSATRTKFRSILTFEA